MPKFPDDEPPTRPNAATRVKHQAIARELRKRLDRADDERARLAEANRRLEGDKRQLEATNAALRARVANLEKLLAERDTHIVDLELLSQSLSARIRNIELYQGRKK